MFIVSKQFTNVIVNAVAVGALHVVPQWAGALAAIAALTGGARAHCLIDKPLASDNRTVELLRVLVANWPANSHGSCTSDGAAYNYCNCYTHSCAVPR